VQKTTTPTRPLRTTAALALIASLALLAGCVTKPKAPDRHTETRESLPKGAIKMPAGADIRNVRLIEKGERVRIYTEVLGIDDPANKTLLFPAEMMRGLNITNVQMKRRFMDTISRTRRFEVLDGSSTVVADLSDLVVDAMVTQVTQALRPIEGGVRVSVTTVRLSLQAKNRIDGTPLLVGGLEVVGQTGASTGDREVLRPGERENDPAVQRRLGIDYERALQRAFDEGVKRLANAVRPMGKVVSVDGNQFGMLGGQAHGFQGGDEVVVFRATMIRLPNGKQEFASTRPVAVAKCEGAGNSTSQCVLIKLSPDLKPEVNDMVVLSDFSATGVRID
jgi:hypothetical protein